MCNIHFELSVPNGNVKTIMLRKFFQMVFLGDDHKSLCIYTAIVFSGEKDKVDDINKYISSSDAIAKTFYMNCKFEVDDLQACFDFEDCSDSLWDQTSCLDRIWGKCAFCETQDSVRKNLVKMGIPEDKIDSDLSAVDIENKPLFFEEEAKGNSHKSIVKKGEVKSADTHNNKKEVSIAPSKELHNGMESLVWFKSNIHLSRSFTSNNFTYNIDLSIPKGTVCYTPDFTLYFTPPVGYEVVYERATVSIEKENKGIRNAVNFVANETTVNFKEWIREHIEEKNKCRVLFTQVVSDPCELAYKVPLAVSFQIENVKSAGNRQFLLGIIVSAILTFGLDYTRLETIKNWISVCKIPSDIVWLLLVIPFLFSLLLKYPAYLEKGMKIFLRLMRWGGIIIFSMWFFMVFIVLRITSPECIPKWIIHLDHLFMAMTFICNAIYNIVCMRKRSYELIAMIKN